MCTLNAIRASWYRGITKNVMSSLEIVTCNNNIVMYPARGGGGSICKYGWLETGGNWKNNNEQKKKCKKILHDVSSKGRGEMNPKVSVITSAFFFFFIVPPKILCSGSSGYRGTTWLLPGRRPDPLFRRSESLVRVNGPFVERKKSYGLSDGREREYHQGRYQWMGGSNNDSHSNNNDKILKIKPV